MTKIKLCGISRLCDIETVNELKPEYIGFVFFKKSIRYITPEKAAELKKALSPDISAVGVFVDEKPQIIAKMLSLQIINIAQLHGNEDEVYIEKLKELTDKPIIKAFKTESEKDIENAQKSKADYVLLDSGNGGTGTVFDWELINYIKRPFFLAGGLKIDNIKTAIRKFEPYAVDVSSGIETNNLKDKNKMTEFVHAVRSVKRKEDI